MRMVEVVGGRGGGIVEGLCWGSRGGGLMWVCDYLLFLCLLSLVSAFAERDGRGLWYGRKRLRDYGMGARC